MDCGWEARVGQVDWGFQVSRGVQVVRVVRIVSGFAKTSQEPEVATTK